MATSFNDNLLVCFGPRWQFNLRVVHAPYNPDRRTEQSGIYMYLPARLEWLDIFRWLHRNHPRAMPNIGMPRPHLP